MVPDELTNQRRWVLYKEEPRPGGKVGKVPYRTDGFKADQTDPDHWSSYEDVVDHIVQYDGIGFCLSGSGYAGIDFDDCVVDGQVVSDVQAIVDELGSWTEYSPSGEGLHTVVRAGLESGFKPEGPIDCVIVDGYVTVTGKHLAGDEIADGTEFLESIERKKTANGEIVFKSPERLDAARAAIAKVEIGDESDGSTRLVKYARQCVRWGLSVDEAIIVIDGALEENPTPTVWTNDEIGQRWQQAHRDVEFGEAWTSRDFSNYEQVGKVKVGIPLTDVLADFWSRFVLYKCREILFDPEGRRIRKTAELFAWMQQHVHVDWAEGAGKATKAEFLEAVTDEAKRFDSIEVTPHFPPVEGVYYAKEFDIGQVEHLWDFVDLFNPVTEVDRQLIAAATVTPFWGGPPGGRPLFAITSPDQDGSGKTTLVDAISSLVNLGRPGGFSVTSSRDFNRLLQHMLRVGDDSRRLVTIDNFKGSALSGQDVESMITARDIDGHVLYRGFDRRANLFTWFLTGNFIEMSKDMSVRTVEIRIKKPTEYSPNWKDKLLAVDPRRVIGGIGAFFQLAKGDVDVNRWDVWGREVLGRLDSPEIALEEINTRSAGLNVVDEEAAELREILIGRLKYHGFKPEADSVFIPSRLLARWLAAELGNRGRAVWTSNSATRFVKRLLASSHLKELGVSKHGYFRGFVWRGGGVAIRYDLSDIENL